MYVEPNLDAMYPTLASPAILVETDSCLYVDVYKQDSQLHINLTRDYHHNVSGSNNGWGQVTISLPMGTYNVLFVASTIKPRGVVAITNVLLENKTCISGERLFSPIPLFFATSSIMCLTCNVFQIISTAL